MIILKAASSLTTEQFILHNVSVCGTPCVPLHVTGVPIHQDVFSQCSYFFGNLFDTSDWPLRWHCGTWSDFHGWLYILSDLLIFASYFTISVLLIYMLRNRSHIPFAKIIWLFVAFIILCGSIHLLDALIFWRPTYRLSALIRLITGIFSAFTVFALYKILPQILSLRTVNELEVEIQERKIAQQSARENHELLVESHQQLNSFTHIITHNVKNHAANMTMLLSLTDQDKLDKDNLILINKIIKVSEGLNDTLKDLSEAVKIRNKVIVPEIILFQEMGLKVISILQAEISAHKATVQFDFTVKQVLFPKLYLESIFINLVSNALKYKSQSKQAKVMLRTYLNEQSEIVLECEDNGIGIDLKIHGDKIFGLYQTFHDHQNAHGVGLFLVKSQVESQKGHISVSSQVEVGTTFKVVFDSPSNA